MPSQRQCRYMDGPRQQPRTATGLLWAVLLALALYVGANGAPLAVPFFCRLNEVRCPSGIKQCVRATKICNGLKDCSDGSDERPAFCARYNCSNRDIELSAEPQDEFYSQTGLCPSKKMCTKKPVFRRSSAEDEFVFYHCNGGPSDCADGSDEDPEYCRKVDCSRFRYGMHNATKCPSGRYCLYASCPSCTRAAFEYLCDGVPDCPDGSDEWPSYCKKTGCGTFSQFECSNGKCLQFPKICDGVKDCPGGEDEDPTRCRSHRCALGYSKCPDGRTCLPSRGICDGKQHCPDGSDEDPDRCRSYRCPLGAWKCKDGLQCTSRSSSSETRCDSVYDCKDKSDEARKLCLRFRCGEGSVKCPGKRGGCIATGKLCDGKMDCLDGSDEGKDFCKTFRCPAGQIKCRKDNKCIYGGLCDGRVDCDDSTDEDPSFCRYYRCPAGTRKCPGFKYQCIKIQQVCDGTRQCIGGGDEKARFCRRYKCPIVDGGQYGKCPDGVTCSLGC